MDSSPGSSRGQRTRQFTGRWRAGISAAVVAAACAWIGWIAWESRESWADVLVGAHFTWLLVPTALNVAAMLFSAAVFQHQLADRAGCAVGYAYAARLLFVGAMVRHLPGRFWGVLYQANEARYTVGSVAVLGANLDYVLVSTFTAATVPLAVLVLLSWGWLAGAAAIGMSAAFTYAWLRHGERAWLPALARWLPPFRRLGSMGKLLQPRAAPSRRDALLQTSRLGASWALYLAAWSSLDRVFPQLEGHDLVWLCAVYTASWIVGFAAVLVPAGLGVREAVFLMLSPASVPASLLVWLAVFLRLWLLLIDLILFAVFLPLRYSGGNQWPTRPRVTTPTA